MDSTTTVALVTGANQGIGRQVAEDLAREGWIVFVGSRDLARGQAAAEKIGGEARAVQLDVTDPTSVAAAAEQVRREAGHLDVLVNNAAISHASGAGTALEDAIAAGRATAASLDDVRAVFETNVFGVIAVTQAMLPLLRESPTPRVVNVSSGVGSLALNLDPTTPFRQGFGVTYAASKTALNAVTVSFAIELEDAGVKVRAVSPGFVATNLNNYAGTETVEAGSRSIVAAALDADGPTGTFTGPEGPIPW